MGSVGWLCQVVQQCNGNNSGRLGGVFPAGRALLFYEWYTLALERERQDLLLCLLTLRRA